MDTTRDVVEKGREAAEDTMAELQSRFEQGKEAARKYAEQGKEAAKKYAAQAGELAKKTRDETELRIKENPFWSMLIAIGVGAGIGLALGMVFGPRRED